MTLHKLSAGDGYTDLTQQVAAFDATEKGHVGLGDYYPQRGESPGVWTGRGLRGLPGVTAGQRVAEDEMKALFGEGRHPDAARLEREALAEGQSPTSARATGALGQAFSFFSLHPDGFRARCAREFAAFNTSRGLARASAISLADRARTAATSGGRCSSRYTVARHTTTVNCPASSPARPGRRPRLSPGTT